MIRDDYTKRRLPVDVFDSAELKHRHIRWVFALYSFGVTVGSVSAIGWHLLWCSLLSRIGATCGPVFSLSSYCAHAIAIGCAAAVAAGLAIPRFGIRGRLAQIVLVVVAYYVYIISFGLPMMGVSIVRLAGLLLVGAIVGEGVGHRLIAPLWERAFCSIALCFARVVNR